MLGPLLQLAFELGLEGSEGPDRQDQTFLGVGVGVEQHEQKSYWQSLGPCLGKGDSAL